MEKYFRAEIGGTIFESTASATAPGAWRKLEKLMDTDRAILRGQGYVVRQVEGEMKGKWIGPVPAPDGKHPGDLATQIIATQIREKIEGEVVKQVPGLLGKVVRLVGKIFR